jgi:hypothetical protein
MPDLIHSLHSSDIGRLRIVAGLWGMELIASETDSARDELAAALLDPELVHEIVDSLSSEARSALDILAGAGGKIPWAAFARQFGEIREAGPGRRDREQVYLHPISTAETLFYRALMARAFFDTPSGAQEFAYIPDDLLPIIHPVDRKEFTENTRKDSAGFGRSVAKNETLGRPASPKERENPLPAFDHLLDDATTFLAAMRLGVEPPEMLVPPRVMREFLLAAKLVQAGEDGKKDSLLSEVARSFLEASRKDALERLAKAWADSETFNELRLLPGITCEGEWTNQPLVTRRFLLDLLDALPGEKWWSLPAFLRAFKEKYPDFQRPAGDYDSWFIKRVTDGIYLRGFATWDEVDGALVRYLITGPLYWLGMVELGTPAGNEVITAFRIKSKAERQTSDLQSSAFNEKGKLTVTSGGKISVPRFVPRAARYLIARFCEWDETKPDEYRYHVTAQSLKKAQEQGLKVSQLLSLLAKNAAAEIPPAFVKALKRWELSGTEARLEVQTVLRVSRPEVLEELRKSKAGRFLGESLGPVTVIVKPGAQSKVLGALAELGLLAENEHKEES